MKLPPDLERKCLELAHIAPEQAAEVIRVSEKEFLWRVINYAEAHGWKVYHTYDSRRSEPGFPDLVMVRDRVVVAELKTEKGRLTSAQDKWLLAFRFARVEAYDWRPSDWPQIEKVLA